jgi:hypothetical protein
MNCVGATGRAILVLAMALGIAGCGERVDELGPYVEKLREVDQYNRKLVEFRFYVKSDQPNKAAALRETIQAYLALMETFGHTDDKFIKAGHNALKRKLQASLNKLVEPDFPTFTISALRQIDLIEEGYTQHVNNLTKRWAEEERPGEFDLGWPGSED